MPIVSFNYTENELPSNRYGAAFYFCNVEPIRGNSGKEVDLCIIHGWTECREYLTLYLRRRKMTQFSKLASTKANIVITPGHEAFVSNKALKQFHYKVKVGLKFANEYESYHNWPLTKMSIFDDPKHRFYHIRGCRRWTKSPYLFSLWTLLLRMGNIYDKRAIPREGLGHFELANEIREALEKDRIDEELTSYSGQVLYTIPYWDFLMKHYLEIFAGHSPQWHWGEDMLEPPDYSRPEGILKLVMGDTLHKEMRKKMKKVCKKYGLAYPSPRASTSKIIREY